MALSSLPYHAMDSEFILRFTMYYKFYDKKKKLKMSFCQDRYDDMK